MGDPSFKTLAIPPGLHRLIKIRAAEEGLSIHEYVRRLVDGDAPGRLDVSAVLAGAR